MCVCIFTAEQFAREFVLLSIALATILALTALQPKWSPLRAWSPSLSAGGKNHVNC